MPWVAITSTVSSLLGGSMQANAASDAADQQTAAANQANATQRYMYDTTRADNAPFLETGTAANKRLRMLMGLDGGQGDLLNKFSQSDLEADPVYQNGLKFGLDTGVEGINARATAGGMRDSGATLKALTRFGNDYGSTKANESFNRFNTTKDSIYNKLAGVSGTGQVATGQVASAGMNAANQIGAGIEGAGNARAAGIVGGANAWGGALNNVSGAMNNYQSNRRLDALIARYPSGGSSYGGSPYGSNSSDYGYYG